MSENGNGRWQLAFWLITAICGVWLLVITQGVIANDRINNSEHKDLRICLYDKLASIESRLTRIETKIERR